MRMTAKADYAVRACLELSGRYHDGYIKAEEIAGAQHIPAAFVLGILSQLRRSAIVESKRGLDGGYRLAMPPDRITVADVVRAIDGPLASVAGSKMEDVLYEGSAAHLRTVWVALRTAMRTVLETTTLADVTSGTFGPEVMALVAHDEAWITRPHGMDVLSDFWDHSR